MWELDYKESWAPKNLWFWVVVLEKTLESPLDCKEIQPVHPKANQSLIFIGMTDAEAETPILWPPDAKDWLIWKDPDAGKDWRQEEKGTTEDKMVGWHHRLDGCEFEYAPGVGEVQGSLACCSPWGRKESDTTKQLNWTELLCTRNSSFPLNSLPLFIRQLQRFGCSLNWYAENSTDNTRAMTSSGLRIKLELTSKLRSVYFIKSVEKSHVSLLRWKC